ncbi:uncharacterized protein LOC133362363 isoform X1 [Lethenteron reissneri]|uniref:uncharacterized protein LOC133362363 isoform X1 n=1 Tax=Lethenteron reissneri TaxID=7753 RepID=UPI002AB7B293|nr:uncharacterized protein LOC133362363 isoform X1 [Lethenteron reissneri]
MQPAASAQAASHSAGEIQARVGGCGEEEEEEDEAMQLLTIVTGDLISGYVAHLTQQTEQQQQPLLQQGLQQQLQQQLQQLQEQLPAVQQHLLLSQQQQQQWMEKLWQQQFQHMQQVQEQLQQVQRQQELVQQLQQQEQLLDVQQQQQLLQELQKKYQLQEVQLMRRFKQLHQMQQEHFQQLQQFKEWQELQRQARQIQRQLREVRSLLQTSRRLVRMRVELLQEALDTRGDALLAEFEASIPDFVRRAEELAKQVDPRRLVVTLAWQVLTAGPMSWGCVLSMVVFCALLVKNLRASGRLGDSEETWPLTDAVAAVLLTTCKTWLMEQGGWLASTARHVRLGAGAFPAGAPAPPRQAEALPHELHALAQPVPLGRRRPSCVPRVPSVVGGGAVAVVTVAAPQVRRLVQGAGPAAVAELADARLPLLVPGPAQLARPPAQGAGRWLGRRAPPAGAALRAQVRGDGGQGAAPELVLPVGGLLLLLLQVWRFPATIAGARMDVGARRSPPPLGIVTAVMAVVVIVVVVAARGVIVSDGRGPHQRGQRTAAAAHRRAHRAARPAADTVRRGRRDGHCWFIPHAQVGAGSLRLPLAPLQQRDVGGRLVGAEWRRYGRGHLVVRAGVVVATVAAGAIAHRRRFSVGRRGGVAVVAGASPVQECGALHGDGVQRARVAVHLGAVPRAQVAVEMRVGVTTRGGGHGVGEPDRGRPRV